MSWILVVAAALLALPFVLGPAQILLRVRTDREVRFEEVDEPLPAEIESDFERFAAALERCGFGGAVRWRTDSAATGQRSLALALCDEATGRAGVVYAVLDAAGRVASRLRQISCVLADGAVLSVNSTTVPGVFDLPPGWRAFNFPDIHDGELLCRLHDTALAHFAGGRAPRPLTAARMRHEIEELNRRHVRHQVEVGLLRERGESLAPTARGAFVMTWRLLWPWKQLAARRRRRDAMLLLSLLGPARPAPPRPAVP
jgi:hypothetical protein